jgi:predicted TIM-barrel fold metal-dependent hydrolase
VEKACVIAACDASQPNNNAFVAELCRAHPDRFTMLSELSPCGPDRDTLLDFTIEQWPALGFRHIVKVDEQPETWLASADAGFWRRVDEARLFVAVNLAPHQSAQLPPLIRRCPNVRWMIDHMGRPRCGMSAADYQPVLDLARFPNVYVKVSGFYAFTADPAEYPYADLARFILALRDTYGAQRLLWASDAPCVLDYSSYAQSYRCLAHVQGLSETDLLWILGRTARTLFR